MVSGWILASLGALDSSVERRWKPFFTLASQEGEAEAGGHSAELDGMESVGELLKDGMSL